MRQGDLDADGEADDLAIVNQGYGSCDPSIMVAFDGAGGTYTTQTLAIGDLDDNGWQDLYVTGGDTSDAIGANGSLYYNGPGGFTLLDQAGSPGGPFVTLADTVPNDGVPEL